MPTNRSRAIDAVIDALRVIDQDTNHRYDTRREQAEYIVSRLSETSVTQHVGDVAAGATVIGAVVGGRSSWNFR
jgi:hypothetical protein